MKTYTFKDSARLFGFLRVVILIYIALSVCVIVAEFLTLNYAYSFDTGDYLLGNGADDAGAALDNIVFAAYISWLCVYTVSVISSLFLIYRYCANALANGAEMNTTPGWSIAWYFIPIANLWKPYQAMREIWLGHMADGDKSGSDNLIGYWWVVWILALFAGRYSGRVSDRVNDIDDLAFSAQVGIVSVLLVLITSVLYLRILTGLQRMQQDKTGVAEVFS